MTVVIIAAAVLVFFYALVWHDQPSRHRGDSEGQNPARGENDVEESPGFAWKESREQETR